MKIENSCFKLYMYVRIRNLNSPFARHSIKHGGDAFLLILLPSQSTHGTLESSTYYMGFHGPPHRERTAAP